MKRTLGKWNGARGILVSLCWVWMGFVGGLGETAHAQNVNTNKLMKQTSFEEWLTKAKGGDTNAQYLLGRSYSVFGIIFQVQKPISEVPYDVEAGHRWFLEAAKGGVPEAQYEVGNYFYRKVAYTFDKKKRADLVQAAFVWLNRGAWNGNIDAWRVLGEGHSRGGFFATDLIEAYKWIHLAAEAEERLLAAKLINHLKLPAMRNRLSGQLTGVQIAQAKERAVRFIDAMEKAKKEKPQP